MAVSTSINRIQYTAGGATTIFAFPYSFFAETDLEVYLDEVLQTAGYTVTGIGGSFRGGGNITFAAAPVAATIVTIVRVLPMTQLTDYEDYSNFPADTFENDLDRLVMIQQQLDDRLLRGLYAPITDPAVNLVLPTAADRGGKFAAYDAAGDPIAASGMASVPVTTWAATLLDDPDAASFWATLIAGLGSVPASDISIVDALGYFAATHVEGALAEISEKRLAALKYWELPMVGNVDGEVRHCKGDLPGAFYWDAALADWIPITVDGVEGTIVVEADGKNWNALWDGESVRSYRQWPYVSSSKLAFICGVEVIHNLSANLGGLVVGRNGTLSASAAGLRLNYYEGLVILLGTISTDSVHAFRGSYHGFLFSEQPLGTLEINLGTATYYIFLEHDLEITDLDLISGGLNVHGYILSVNGDVTVTTTAGKIANTSGKVVFQKGAVDQFVNPGTGNPNFGDVEVLVSGTRVEQQANMQVDDLFIDTGCTWDRNGFTLTINGSQSGGGTLI